MAWLEQRSNRYHIVFRFNGQKFKRSLGTSSESEAEDVLSRVERRTRLIEQGDIELPENADVPTFLITGEMQPIQIRDTHLKKQPRTLEALCQNYFESLPSGSLEATTLRTAGIHVTHLKRVFGQRFQIKELTLADLQRYVNHRSREKGRRGKNVSPVTIRKELATFSVIWNWAINSGIIEKPFPNRGLRYPKIDDKPPFQTFQEITQQIERGHLEKNEQVDLWECLYLTAEDINSILQHVQGNATHPVLYSMVLMAAHTGARRSEICRVELRDCDLSAGTILLRERKRSKTRRTHRSVPMSQTLQREIKKSIDQNGRYAF